MAQLPLIVVTPAVNFALGIQGDRKRTLLLSDIIGLKFADQAVFEVHFVHEEFLWAFDQSEFTLAPNEDLARLIDCG